MDDPVAHARELETLAATLKRDVVRWLERGGDAGCVADGARRQQLLYGRLRREPHFARRLLDEIEVDLRLVVRAHVDSASILRNLVTPVELVYVRAVAELE